MTAPDFLESQLYLYRLLSALYRYPLTGEKLAALAALTLADDFPLAQALGELQATVEGADDAALESLNVEMTRLLEGPGVTPAVPYASFYLNGKQLMGPAAPIWNGASSRSRAAFRPTTSRWNWASSRSWRNRRWKKTAAKTPCAPAWLFCVNTWSPGCPRFAPRSKLPPTSRSSARWQRSPVRQWSNSLSCSH
ncbi:MAG: molecular chaperone TorD family protein [Chloroflexota bacterium]|jgi:hypothetical protein